MATLMLSRRQSLNIICHFTIRRLWKRKVPVTITMQSNQPTYKGLKGTAANGAGTAECSVEISFTPRIP